MTPSPQSVQPPVQQSVLPIVGLVLAVIGFCIPCFFPIGVILAIVSLVKSGEPAYAARKTLAIVTLAIAVAWVPMVGILAAIAIPNFIKFQARAKQTECKSNLRVAYSAQRGYFGQEDHYGETFDEISFRIEPGNRYSYFISPKETVPGMGDSRLPSDIEVGISGTCPDCQVTMACVGNIDNDSTLDVWTVSSEDRVVNGEQVVAGTPHNDVNDLEN